MFAASPTAVARNELSPVSVENRKAIALAVVPSLVAEKSGWKPTPVIDLLSEPLPVYESVFI